MIVLVYLRRIHVPDSVEVSSRCIVIAERLIEHFCRLLCNFVEAGRSLLHRLQSAKSGFLLITLGHYDLDGILRIANILEHAGGSATDKLNIRAGLGLLSTEYTKLALPRLSTPLDAGDMIDLAGNELVSSPENNFNYAIDYEIPIGAKWYARLHLDGNYIGDQWFSAYNRLDGHADIRQDAYRVHNARVTFESANERLALSLWGQNILDEEYNVFAINLQGGFGYNYFLEGRPRTYGAEFSYRF